MQWILICSQCLAINRDSVSTAWKSKDIYVLPYTFLKNGTSNLRVFGVIIYIFWKIKKTNMGHTFEKNAKSNIFIKYSGLLGWSLEVGAN